MKHDKYTLVDLNAPRHFPKTVDLAAYPHRDLNGFYAAMKGQYPELAKYTNSQIAKCIYIFNCRISKEVIDNKNGVRLSDGLGIVVAGACKISKEAAMNNTNYALSDSLQINGESVKIPYQNLHSDTYIAKVKYSNALDQHLFDNHHMWMFDACRDLARSVSKEFQKGNHKNYIVFTTRQHIGHLFRKLKIQNVSSKERNDKERLAEHDEFAFN